MAEGRGKVITIEKLVQQYAPGSLTRSELFYQVQEDHLECPASNSSGYKEWCNRTPPGPPLLQVCCVVPRREEEV